MENEVKVYDYVKEIADDQYGKKEKITRADVAYILQEKYKVQCVDGSELGACIYRAYEHHGKAESIRWAIMSNGGDKSVVEQCELNARLAGGETEHAISIVEKDLNESQDLIDKAKQRIVDVLKLELLQDGASLSKWLQGTSGLDTIKSKSSALMQNYGKMVESYNAAEDGVKNDIHDFVEMRSEVNARFMQYATALVDIFGDSIRVVAPQLFDFENVKYLDASAMQQRTQLEFDKLDENCTLLLGEIASHYTQTVEQMPLWLKMSRSMGPKGGLYGSLAMGAVSYLNHWLSAQEKTARMQKEYANFENSVKRDRHQMDGDMMRLMTIHKVMNDLYIPRAVAFARRSDEVMSDDMKQLLGSIYAGEVAPMVKERDALLARMKSLEQSINDHHESIAMFDAQITDIKGILSSQKENYEKAEERKPTEPGLMKRFFTFGVAQRNYGRRLLEWDEQDGVLVRAYEDAMMDLDEGMQDKNAHNEQLEKDKNEYEACKKRLAELNRTISEKIRCTPDQKASALKHLKNLLALLQAGKKIAESKLDDSLLDVVVPPHKEEIAGLPSDIERNLRGFVGDVCDEIKKNGGAISETLIQEFGLSDAAEKSEISHSVVQAVDKASELIRNWSYMQTDQMKSQLSGDVYALELDRMKKEFQTTMAALNQESDALTEVLKRVNTAVEKEDLRKALLDLSGKNECDLSEQDFDDLLAGKKQIEL